jgi:hypothetical protein
MALSQEFREFVQGWIHKAGQYSTSDIRECFDKFFTLYVAFNRIYAEATFTLDRRGQISIKKRDSFPDPAAATGHFLQFVTAEYLVSEISSDASSRQALQRLISVLKGDSFYVKLHKVTGEAQPQEDKKLLENFESNSSAAKGRAILETIYSLRCNMFHGQKSFHQVQLQILVPVISLLERVIQLGLQRLEEENR